MVTTLQVNREWRFKPVNWPYIEIACNNQACQSLEAILVQPMGGGCVNKVVVGQHLYTFIKNADGEEELRQHV